VVAHRFHFELVRAVAVLLAQNHVMNVAREEALNRLAAELNHNAACKSMEEGEKQQRNYQ
jgi:hypothetical protein